MARDLSPSPANIPPRFQSLIVYLFSLGYAGLLGIGYFARPAGYGPLHFALILLWLTGLILLLLRLLKDQARPFGRGLEFGLALLIAGWIPVQMTGGLGSPAYPLLYLLFAVLAASVQPLEIVILFLFLAGLEALIRRVQPLPVADLSTSLSHLACSPPSG